jgi:hypothetical protein
MHSKTSFAPFLVAVLFSAVPAVAVAQPLAPLPSAGAPTSSATPASSPPASPAVLLPGAPVKPAAVSSSTAAPAASAAPAVAPGAPVVAEPIAALPPPGAPPEPSAAPQSEQEDAPASSPSGSLMQFWQATFALGARAIFSQGLEPFAKRPTLGAIDVRVERTLFTRGKWSVSAGLGFEYSGVSSTARQFDSSLTLPRLAILGEARYHFSSRFYGYGQVAPGIVFATARIDDPSSAQSRSAFAPLFAADLALGGAVLVTDTRGAKKHPARLWLFGEFGAGLSTANKFELTTGENDAREQATKLPSFATNGIKFRLGLSLTM